MGLEAGEAFVHRNITNLVVILIINVMSAIHYAVRHLQVKHIVVCGHYNCGQHPAKLFEERVPHRPWMGF
jgi:carbonic anhydrase